MEYQALYRKYRPSVFDDLKGQDMIVRTLRNQISTGRTSHAYLFCGSRGTGKTSAAKIFARAVNCDNKSDGNPCGVCENCRAIQEGRSMNVAEVDAASRNGVADFRQIIEEIEYPPSSGHYKVYIIDEVHMLSAAAFNAFLKTLEEPPSYAIFILATTDPQKLPVTILSRCQRYDFKRIPSSVIAARLKEIFALEKLEAEDKAIDYIAMKSEGGMRDALSLADQCISFFMGDKLTYEHLLEVLGTADSELFSAMLRSAAQGDASGLLDRFHHLLMDGGDIRQIVSDFTKYIRDLLIFRASGGSEKTMELLGEDRELLTADSSLVSENELMYYVELLSDLSASIRNSSNRRVLTEVMLIRMCRPQTSPHDLNAVLTRLEHVERLIEEGAVYAGPAKAAGDAQRGGRLSGEEAVYGDLKAGQKPPSYDEEEGDLDEDHEKEADYLRAKELPASRDKAESAGSAGNASSDGLNPELFNRIFNQWKITVNHLGDPGISHILGMFSNPAYRKSDPGHLYVVIRNFWEAYRTNEKIRQELENLVNEKYKCRLQLSFVSEREFAQSGPKKEKSEDSITEALRKQGVNFPVEMEDT